MKIKSLTKEQESKFQYYIDKWILIGTCTKPIPPPIQICPDINPDRILAEKALHDVYKTAGLNPPKEIVWKLSPLEAFVYIVEQIEKESVRNSVGNSVGDSVGNSVLNSVRNSVRNSVGNSVWNSVKNSVGNSVRNSVWNSVGDSVWNSVRNSVGNSVWNSVENILYGQQDAYELSFYDFFRETCGLKEETEKILPLMELSKHTNWVFPYENIAIMCEKPIICSLKNGVIHSEVGPAIAYKDGFEIYAIDGNVITKEEFKTIEYKQQFDLIVEEV